MNNDETQRHAALEARVRQRDREALGLLLAEYRPQLLAYIDRKLGAALRSKVEADDLLQEVSTDCLRALAEIELAERDLFGWFCQVSDRRIVDAHRRYVAAQKRSAAREAPLAGGDDSQAGLVGLLVASITSPSKAFSRDQREFRLLAALDQLPEDGRQAIQMRYAEGLPSKEIAEKLGKSDGAVRVLLTRMLQKLQGLLDEEEKA